jgi:hypothetical protein
LKFGFLRARIQDLPDCEVRLRTVNLTKPNLGAANLCRRWLDVQLLFLGDPVEDFTELIQRLLAIQSAGREKSLKAVAADRRLIDGWQSKNRTEDSPAVAELSQSGLSDHSAFAQRMDV